MFFKNGYDFLSNFYISPFIINGKEYKTVEHYYQSQKTDNYVVSEKIRKCNRPNEAKKLGNECKLRRNWDKIKYPIMTIGVNEKFRQNFNLKEKLLNISDDIEIIEDNYWHDNYWGRCNCHKCSLLPHYNNLGKILDMIRKGNLF